MFADEEADQLIEIVSEVARNDLRSVVHFTADDFAQPALRDSLPADANISAFVENEQTGFHRTPTHNGSDWADTSNAIQRFEHGSLVRVVDDSRGMFVTTSQHSDRSVRRLCDHRSGALPRYRLYQPCA